MFTSRTARRHPQNQHRSRTPSNLPVTSAVVIGLGRFGSALAQELMDSGVEVLAIDNDPAVVQEAKGLFTSVVRADATSPATLQELGVADFPAVVVAIGTDLEASVLTTSRLLTMEHGPVIWAKAISEAHGQILEQLGVEHVIRPEHDMGLRTAHLLIGHALDFVSLDGGFALIRCGAPAPVQQRPLDTLDLQGRYRVTLVAVRRPDQQWAPVEAGLMLYDDDEIMVTGTKHDVERFAGLRDGA